MREVVLKKPSLTVSPQGRGDARAATTVAHHYRIQMLRGFYA